MSRLGLVGDESDGSLKGSFLKYSLMREASLEMFKGLRAGRQVRGQMPSCSILSTSDLRMMLLCLSLWVLTIRPLTNGISRISTLWPWSCRLLCVV